MARRRRTSPNTTERPPEPAPVAAPWRGLAAPLVALLVPMALYAAAFQRPAHDTWTSLACGRHIVQHGVSDVDPFSFSSRQGRPGATLVPRGWVNQNWLSQVVIYRVWAVAGGNGLVGLKVGLYALLALLLVVACRVAGASWGLAAVAVAVVLGAGRSFFEIRAQDLGNLCCGLLLIVVAGASTRPRRAWWLVALTALWCNLHGSFVLVPIAAAVALVGGALATRGSGLAVVPAADWWRHWAGAGLASLVVSVVLCPFHLALLVTTVAPAAGVWRQVGEWRSPLALGGSRVHLLPFLLVAGCWLALVVAVVAAGRRAGKDGLGRAPSRALEPALLGLFTVTVVLALTSRRFVAVALLAAAPAAAHAVSRLARRLGGPVARRPAWLPAVLWLGVAALTAWSALSIHRVYLRPWPRLPADAPPLDRLVLAEGELAGPCAFLRANLSGARLFNLWEDGGYLAWCQEPGPDGRLPDPIFIDGRAQLAYDARAATEYLDLLAGGPEDRERCRREAAPWQDREGGWVHQRLRRDRIWAAVLPVTADGSRLAGWLLDLQVWQPVYSDGQGMVLADVATAEGAALRDAVLAGRATFPNRASGLTSEAALRVQLGGGDEARRAFAAALEALAMAPEPRALSLAVAAAAKAPELGPELERALEGQLARFAGPRPPVDSLPAIQAGVYAAEQLHRRAAAGGDRASAARLDAEAVRLRRLLADVHRSTRW